MLNLYRARWHSTFSSNQSIILASSLEHALQLISPLLKTDYSRQSLTITQIDPNTPAVLS